MRNTRPSARGGPDLRAGAAVAALALAEPVTAVVLAALVLKQQPALPPVAVLGALVAAVGVVLLESRDRA